MERGHLGEAFLPPEAVVGLGPFELGERDEYFFELKLDEVLVVEDELEVFFGVVVELNSVIERLYHGEEFVEEHAPAVLVFLGKELEEEVYFVGFRRFEYFG